MDILISGLNASTKAGNNDNFSNDLCIEFFTNTVMEIDKKGNLIALWLKPVFK